MKRAVTALVSALALIGCQTLTDPPLDQETVVETAPAVELGRMTA